MIVTFFGNKELQDDIYSVLLQTIMDLIEDQNADWFFVGNENEFDRMVSRILKMLSAEYPHIGYEVVMPHYPDEDVDIATPEYDHIRFPDSMERLPHRAAIEKRNRWMLDGADTVVTYVRHPHSDAARFQASAKKSGKKVIDLAERMR